MNGNIFSVVLITLLEIFLTAAGMFYLIAGVSGISLVDQCEKKGYYNFRQTVIKCSIEKQEKAP